MDTKLEFYQKVQQELNEKGYTSNTAHIVSLSVLYLVHGKASKTCSYTIKSFLFSLSDLVGYVLPEVYYPWSL